MITFKTGNIFEADIEAIVNTVNCIGIMGRGIALQFKKNIQLTLKLMPKQLSIRIKDRTKSQSNYFRFGNSSTIKLIQ
jgi:O-acetyl-ADP-ribose deacetylase (regulator of RNase III)